jgi:hypothetical protein
MLSGTPGLMPGARKDKESVNYRRAEKCVDCDYFLASGTCTKVAGNISPQMTCDLWEIKSEQPQGKGRAYYESEYNKMNPDV